MKYAVISCSNGTFHVDSEWTDNLSSAKINFWDRCKALENASDVLKAKVAIFDDNLDVVEGKKEEILHTPAPEPEPTPIVQPESE